MIRNSLFSLGALALLTATAQAQFCTDNQFRLILVNAQGIEAPTFLDPLNNEVTYQFDSEAVYLAFDPATPTGTYYVHVTDPIGNGDQVLSNNDPMDRFVASFVGHLHPRIRSNHQLALLAFVIERALL